MKPYVNYKWKSGFHFLFVNSLFSYIKIYYDSEHDADKCCYPIFTFLFIW